MHRRFEIWPSSLKEVETSVIEEVFHSIWIVPELFRRTSDYVNVSDGLIMAFGKLSMDPCYSDIENEIKLLRDGIW